MLSLQKILDMNTSLKISVFCGSRIGKNPAYIAAAKRMGKLFADNDITLVYGGGKVGLMGILADEILQNGGKVIGVLPRFFDFNLVGHANLTEMIYVDTMNERKYKMEKMSDAFIALAGGYGTLDEVFEMVSNLKLHQHNSPVALLNTEHFYDYQIKQLDVMLREGFIDNYDYELLIKDATPEGLLQKIFERIKK